VDNTNGSPAATNAVFVLLLGAALIAISPILVRISELGPVATAFHRQLLALPVLWLWMRWDYARSQTPRKPASVRDYRRLVLAGVMFAGDLSLWHWSINLTSIANSTMLVNFAPIFVAIGAWLIYGERFTARFMAGLGATIFGVVLLLGDSSTLGTRHIVGDLLALSAAVCYGGYLLIVGQLRAEFSTATILAWTSTVSCVVLFIIALLAGEELVASTLNGWIILLCLALITHVGGQSMVAYSLAHLPTTFGSVGLMLQPVLAAVLAWMLLNESISGFQLAGGLVIITGIYLARTGAQTTSTDEKRGRRD
jgi:drug/metabolite transporter (DMT)-like permease